jgi:membrane protein
MVPWLQALIDLVRRSITKFVAMAGVDRSMALAAQAFTALFPILIVLAATLEKGHGASFGDKVVDRLDLTGSAADAARRAFPQSGTVEQSVTVLGVVILLISALSFARALQRMYEQAWGLEARGMRDTPYGLLWLACLCLYLSLRPALDDAPHWVQEVASICGSFVIFLGTPYIVLGRRLDWHSLVPQAILAAVGMTALRGASDLYLPRALASSAEQFGTIGFCFALVSWLFAAAIVLTATAALGACLAERRFIPSG